MRLRSRGFIYAGALLFLLPASRVLGQVPGQSGAPGTQLMDSRRDSGLNVAPVFEGWDPNPDGTVSIYFGYMNRNWKEELDIPVGPNNSFEPGPQDRGQPTHFLSRRHKQVFSVVVPKDFKGTLVWTLSIRGTTERVPASLKPEQQIDVHKDTQNGNTPPKLDAGPDQTVTFQQPVTLTATISDDGLPKARAGRPSLNIQWSKYRGPGTVTFGSAAPPIKDGKAVTTATFGEPGVYVLLALADDGSVFQTSQGQHVPGFACCWTTDTVTVTVKGGSASGGR